MWLGAWPSQTVTDLERALKELQRLVDAPPPDQPDEVARALARFLVVRSAGYLEQVAEECIRAYLSSKGDPRSFSFGASWLGRGMNPTPERLVGLVKRLDTGWAEELRILLDDDDQRLSRELSLMVDRRNKIAHGRSESLGARKALDLVAVVSEVAAWFILRLDPR